MRIEDFEVRLGANGRYEWQYKVLLNKETLIVSPLYFTMQVAAEAAHAFIQKKMLKDAKGDFFKTG